MLSFYSDLSLNYNYFWKVCRPEGYMKLHTAGEIIYSCCRMILQINEILFPSNRRLEETTAKEMCIRDSMGSGCCSDPPEYRHYNCQLPHYMDPDIRAIYNLLCPQNEKTAG